MKIAVTSTGPSIDSAVDERFGRARYIIIYDTLSKTFETVDNETNLNMAQGAGIQTAGNMAEKKVELILTGRVGPKAAEALNKAGIKYVENASGTCRSAIEKQQAA
ncbi:MAG TPA: NifB/NifX family molybdenum-iron cluster-binding protein [Candidatus Wallbacteria bacterium]|nr:NifB/NifX family molybdenum-iron cluster-binding protein [Candidatus Wallbacteria bacterium]